MAYVYTEDTIKLVKEKLSEIAMKNSTPKKYVAACHEALLIIVQLQKEIVQLKKEIKQMQTNENVVNENDK